MEEAAQKTKKPRRLTKKQRGFVNDYADTGNAVKAVLNNYDTKDYNTAAVLGHENINKPNIQEALRELGFDSNNAKRVISNILNDETLEPKDRIKAAENVFKVHGDYAPEKKLNVNVDVEPSDELKKAAQILNEQFRTGIPSDGTLSSTLDSQTQNKE